MHYYSVLTASRAKTDQLFTYSGPAGLKPGRIVRVPFMRFTYYGVIAGPAEPFAKSKPLVPTAHSMPVGLLQAGLKLGEHSAIELSSIGRALLGSANLREASQHVDFGDIKSTPLPALTPDQQKAVDSALGSKAPSLLHGITGSGKTRVYLELCQTMLDQGKSCLVMAPEVGLSTQLSATFKAAWPQRIVELNSGLTPKQKEEAWLKVLLAKEPVIVIGPRSALFSPLQNLGLIVMDEFHDDSYKQTSQPRYHALHLANILAKTSGALAVFGSATPNVTDYYQFKTQKYPLIELKGRVLKSTATEVQVVDTTKEDQQGMLTKTAIEAIKKSLANNQQALVFFNRRGTARLIVCDGCGWSHDCPRCDYNLTLHKDTLKLVCHTCQYTTSPLSSCPDCKQPLSFKIPGIKSLTDQISKNFLNTKVVRFDSDNLKADTLAARLKEVSSQPNTIIVGTQIVSKGLDLKLLSTVVVINSESALSMPDFRSDERMFQQITQLIGRVGRGHTDWSKVVLQTRTPDNPTLIASAAQDWHAFYKAEVKRRQKAKLPPYSYLATIMVKRKTDEGAEKACLSIMDDNEPKYPLIDFRGPSPALRAKQAGNYVWHIHCFSRRRSQLTALARDLNKKEYIELDPLNLF